MNTLKPYILIAVVVLIVGTVYFINSQSVRKTGSSEVVTVIPRTTLESNATTSPPISSSTQEKKDTMPHKEAMPSKFISAEVKSKRYELAKEVTTPDGFINTDGKPITINSLIGKKVILVDFWTYSCINCQRTTPYLNAWYEKYKDRGFVIIGMHTPEFEFEKKYDNVKAAVEKFGIKFPVVLDNDFSTWTAYKNQYWPRKYLIDIDGYIVYDHIGEGGYDETERAIQQALAERMAVLGMKGEIDTAFTTPGGASAPQAGSPEIYFGAGRNEYLGNGAARTAGIQHLSEPSAIAANELYLAGDWNVEKEFAENQNAGAKIIFKYASHDVYFVASAKDGAKINPHTSGGVGVKVLRDGKPLDASIAGEDIAKDQSSTALIKEDRLYKLIHDPAYGEHTIEIIIESPGLRAFTFTFG